MGHLFENHLCKKSAAKPRTLDTFSIVTINEMELIDRFPAVTKPILGRHPVLIRKTVLAIIPTPRLNMFMLDHAKNEEDVLVLNPYVERNAWAKSTLDTRHKRQRPNSICNYIFACHSAWYALSYYNTQVYIYIHIFSPLPVNDGSDPA